MSQATVSVVVPTKNRCQQLQSTLHTVLAQTLPVLEVIVSDDGSDPALSRDALPSDPRICLLPYARSTGASGARNRGLRAANGAWVAFCDDDDLWVPDKLERQLDALTRAGARWCICDAVIVDPDWRIVATHRATPADVAARLHEFNPVPGGGSGVVVERALLDDLGGFDPAFSMFADWDLWLRLHAGDAPAASGSTGVVYRLHAGQMSADLRRVHDELERLLRAHRSGFGNARRLPAIDDWVLGGMRGGCYYRAAFEYAAAMPGLRWREQLETLFHPAMRRAKPLLRPVVDRLRELAGRPAHDEEGAAALMAALAAAALSR